MGAAAGAGLCTIPSTRVVILIAVLCIGAVSSGDLSPLAEAATAGAGLGVPTPPAREPAPGLRKDGGT